VKGTLKIEFHKTEKKLYCCDICNCVDIWTHWHMVRGTIAKPAQLSDDNSFVVWVVSKIHWWYSRRGYYEEYLDLKTENHLDAGKRMHSVKFHELSCLSYITGTIKWRKIRWEKHVTSQIYPSYFSKYSGFSKSMRKILIPRRIIRRAGTYRWDLSRRLRG
jgi:hypothetical protein